MIVRRYLKLAVLWLLGGIAILFLIAVATGVYLLVSGQAVYP